MVHNDPAPSDTLSTLQHVLASASRIAQDLLHDTLLPRLLGLFTRMPPDDRETIVSVLEREVDLRTMSLEGHGQLSGHRVSRPNPNARLYLRVNETEPAPYFAPEEIFQAVIRAARVMHRSVQRGATEMREVWGPGIVAGLRSLDPTERASLRWFHQTILDFIDEAERGSH